MLSDYTVTIKCDPFLIRFLYSHHHVKPGLPISFPARHYMNVVLEELLEKVPKNYKPLDYGDKTLVISIPHLEYRNEEVYNYLSAKRQKLFVKKVKELAYEAFRQKFMRLRRLHGFTKDEAIDVMEGEFGFLPMDRDRLIKHYDRWIHYEYIKKYRAKKKSQKRKVLT